MSEVQRVRGASGAFATMLALMIALGTPLGARADDAEAKKLFKAMSDYMAAQNAISFSYDTSLEIVTDDKQKLALASSGTLEIAPMEAPLALFVWSKNRIIPVRITEFSVTEEAFDPSLNPMRAKVSLGMRVLNVDDLGFEHKGGSLFLVYQKQKERLAGLAPAGSFGNLGIGGIP